MDFSSIQRIWLYLFDPVGQNVIIGIVCVFLLGLIIGYQVRRRKAKRVKIFSREGDDSFFKGIQYMLSNDHDLAIEELTKSVKLNSDTIETYVALGNLYRSKGDIDRAIRIRQTIILRPNIDEENKIRALIDLGLDYRKGGFLNRALEIFLEVLKKRPSNLEALEEAERLYEKMNDWENAFSYRQKLSKLIDGNHSHILAHQQTEAGKAWIIKGNQGRAKSAFQKAILLDNKCIDAYFHLGDLFFEIKDFKKAITAWKKVVRIRPEFTFLVYHRLEGAYSEMKNLKPVEDFLRECAKFNADAFTHMALARYRYNENDLKGALEELEKAIKLNPLFSEARGFMAEILLAQGQRDQALNAYRELVNFLDVPHHEFQCSNCGYRSSDLKWQCPQCKKWDTIDLMDSGKADSSSVRPSEKLFLESSTDAPEKIP
jgi:lipopolysaccharide biosynthesis regulator YciM